MIYVIHWFVNILTLGLVSIATITTTTYHVDEPITELNNQSLNDVFNQGNEAPNSTFDNNINGWLTTFANGYETWENGKVKLDNTSGLGYANIYTNASINNAYYINFDLEIIIGELKVESTGANTYEIFTSLQNGNNSLLVSSLLNSNISFARNVSPSIFYLDNIYLIDLTSLGIDNLTKNQLDDWYNIYVQANANNGVYIESSSHLNNNIHLVDVSVMVISFAFWVWLFKFLKGVIF